MTSFNNKYLFIILALCLLPFAFITPTHAAPQQQPTTPPSAATGYTTFTERCANCHGPFGAGDGTLSANLPAPPAAFNAPDYIDNARPQDLFATITNGRIENGMPPFGPASSNPLTEEQRWQLVATIFSLGTSPTTLDTGATLYQNSCASCHGADGATLDTANLTNTAYWSSRTNQEVAQALPTPAEHEFTLNEADTIAVVAYARSFNYTYFDVDALNKPIENATITGLVTNETSGQLIPDATVLLRGFDGFDLADTYTTTVAANGRYTFTINANPNYTYIAQATVNNLPFNSQFGRVPAEAPLLNLDISAFDTIRDASVIRADRLQIVVEFFDGVILVSEVYQFSNDSDRLFIGNSNVPVGVTIDIPTNASEPVFQRSFTSFDQFFPANDLFNNGTQWTDPNPLYPGERRQLLLVRYELPYDGQQTVQHQLLYNVDNADLIIMDNAVDMTTSSWGQSITQEVEGSVATMYQQASLSANTTVEFAISGEPNEIRVPSQSGTTSTGSTALIRDNNTELAIGSISLFITIVLAAFLINYWRNLPQHDPRQDILHAIAELDDSFEAGTINSSDYRYQREQLKEQLIAIWKQ